MIIEGSTFLGDLDNVSGAHHPVTWQAPVESLPKNIQMAVLLDTIPYGQLVPELNSYFFFTEQIAKYGKLSTWARFYGPLP